MPAYLINDMEVTDPAAFAEYAKLSPPTVALYDGRFLARGGAIALLEGDRTPKRLVIIEFPSVERARAWLESPEYAPARRLRQSAARSNIVVVEGYAPASRPDRNRQEEANMATKTYTKRLGILRKKEGMTHEAFKAHWLGTHAPLCAKLPGLRRYSVNLVDRERFPKFDYDGFSELWFDSEDDLKAAFASPEGVTLLADLPNFAGDIDPIISVETQIVWP